MTTCTFFLCCKPIGKGGYTPPAGGGASPLLPAPPSRKNMKWLPITCRFISIVFTWYLFFLEGAAGRRGEIPPPAGGRSPLAYRLTTQKKCTYCREKKFIYKIFFVHNFFANNNRRIKPSKPYSGPRPWQYMPSSRSSETAPLLCSFTRYANI